ncbi:MAG: hypothetical protein IKO93_06575 [Lentisphaeria bacterium]|nr:hypothetical protein [Lentisphaeria bacterium]
MQRKFFVKKGLILSAAVLIPILSSCVSYDYVGDKYAPTENVRTYFNPGDVPPGMSQIGQITATLPDSIVFIPVSPEFVRTFLISGEELNEKLRDRAKKAGAEAILITGNGTVVTATHMNNSYGRNYSNNGYSGGSSTTRYNSTSKVVHANFYKKLK